MRAARSSRVEFDQLAASDKSGKGPRGTVDVDDEVLTLVKFADGTTGSIEATRNAYGRNNFITLEIHGDRGSIAFNYERMDELQVMFADDPGDARGFRTVYTGPAHPYGSALWPIPALGIGYGETKMIECHDFISAIMKGEQLSPNFRDGCRISEIADAILKSSEAQNWVAVA